MSYSKNAEIVVPGIVEIRRLSDEFGVPPVEHGHYSYVMKYWVEEEKNQRFHLGSFGVNMGAKPKIADYQKTPISPRLAQADKNHFRMKELIYLTNILSEHHFFQYSIHHNWYVEMGAHAPSKWGQTMFSPNKELSELTTKSTGINDADKNILHLTVVATQEQFEVTFSELMKTYLNSAESEVKQTILQGMRTFSKSLELRSVDFNASYLFFYSVLESLAEEEFKNIKNEKCDECKQMVFSVSKKLKALLDKYCYEIPNNEKNKLYEFRSKIVHRGKMLPFTNDHQWVMETQEDLNAFYYSSLSRQYFDWLRKITQLTMKNFIYQNLKST